MGIRFFRHGELPLVLLALLDERPMHGYELMGELARIFPLYRPSPGSVYPAIDALEAEGLVDGEDQGGRTVYRNTRVGRRALEDRRDMLARLEVRTGTRIGQRDPLDSTLDRFSSRVRALSGRLDMARLEELLEQTAAEIEETTKVLEKEG